MSLPRMRITRATLMGAVRACVGVGAHEMLARDHLLQNTPQSCQCILGLCHCPTREGRRAQAEAGDSKFPGRQG